MMESKSQDRRHDIDFLRVVLFGLLIVFHTSLIFGSGIWLINADAPNKFFVLFLTTTHAWRISFLFLISGMVTSLISNRYSPAKIFSMRTRQIIPLLILGLIVVIPPQIYVSYKTYYKIDKEYFDFWKLSLTGAEIMHGEGQLRFGLSFEHLWFLMYILTYTLLWMIIKKHFTYYCRFISNLISISLSSYKIYLIPIIYLSVLRLLLYPVFGETMTFYNDWYAHFVYFGFFLFGVFVVNKGEFWTLIIKYRLLTLKICILCFLFLSVIVWNVPQEKRPIELVIIFRVVRSIFQWLMITTMLAFAHIYIKRPNHIINYLNKGILTYYFWHQTIIVLFAYWLKQNGILSVWSFPLILIVTFAMCALLYELQRFVFRFLASLRLKLFPLNQAQI